MNIRVEFTVPDDSDFEEIVAQCEEFVPANTTNLKIEVAD